MATARFVFRSTADRTARSTLRRPSRVTYRSFASEVPRLPMRVRQDEHFMNGRTVSVRESQMVRALAEYYRCPEEYAIFAIDPESADARDLQEVCRNILRDGARSCSPYDSSEWVDNLRYERYADRSSRNTFGKGPANIVRKGYYLVRPLMPVPVRKHLQKLHLRGWEKIPFPNWPVDRTVELTLEYLLVVSLKTRGIREVPFIWFWPDGYRSCAIMTHDVETEAGRGFCCQLMDINDRWGIKSSFQIIPEERYTVAPAFLDCIRQRGFEVNVHDLNHDGYLFSEQQEFLRRARRINHYVREFKAAGFRSGALYRNPDWYEAFEFSYDMSFPNVAHLDPQRGGCCTIMPFFIGKVLELPLTTTQDYSLFHILNNFSLDLWQQQIGLILEKYGLISFIIHPDYIIEKRARQTYENLLDYLAVLRSDNRIWFALPGEVNHWWRQRSQMTLAFENGKWCVHGDGSERARVAYGTLVDGKLQYTFDVANA
jgi:hypothetical protein